jgi:hypothetical protein
MITTDAYKDLARQNIKLLAILADTILQHSDAQEQDPENEYFIWAMCECQRRIENAINALKSTMPEGKRAENQNGGNDGTCLPQ